MLPVNHSWNNSGQVAHDTWLMYKKYINDIASCFRNLTLSAIWFASLITIKCLPPAQTAKKIEKSELSAVKAALSACLRVFFRPPGAFEPRSLLWNLEHGLGVSSSDFHCETSKVLNRSLRRPSSIRGDCRGDLRDTPGPELWLARPATDPNFKIN